MISRARRVSRQLAGATIVHHGRASCRREQGPASIHQHFHPRQGECPRVAAPIPGPSFRCSLAGPLRRRRWATFLDTRRCGATCLPSTFAMRCRVAARRSFSHYHADVVISCSAGVDKPPCRVSYFSATHMRILSLSRQDFGFRLIQDIST